MTDIKSVWVVEDYKTGNLIGIFATQEIAQRVADEHIECSTVPRELVVDPGGNVRSLEATTCSPSVSVYGKTEPIWKDPETGEVHVDPIWEDIKSARRASLEKPNVWWEDLVYQTKSYVKSLWEVHNRNEGKK